MRTIRSVLGSRNVVPYDVTFSGLLGPRRERHSWCLTSASDVHMIGRCCLSHEGRVRRSRTDEIALASQIDASFRGQIGLFVEFERVVLIVSGATFGTIHTRCRSKRRLDQIGEGPVHA